MPTLKIEKKCKLSADESFKRISNMLETDKDLHKLDPKLSCKFDAPSMTGQANGSQFKAKMKVSEDQQGSVVEISVDLPFHLALVKGMVEKTLSKKLDETLA